MLRFDLKAMLDEYESRTGIRLGYEDLSLLSGIAIDTIKSLANRRNYNATLHTLAKVAEPLGANPIQYLAHSTDSIEDDE